MPDYRVKRPASADDVLGQAVEPLSSAYAGADGPDEQQAVLATFTPGQRLLCAWYLYWDDVTNGGHAQYFANYTGDLWEAALEACDAFAVAEAVLLREAVGLFPHGKPAATPDQRQQQLESVDPEKLNELDARFYDAPASDEQVRQYMDAHRDDFFVADGA